MAEVKLTQLDTTTDFEESLLYGVDKQGHSKAFNTNALYEKLKETSGRDIFKEAEELKSYNTNVYGTPSKISFSLKNTYLRFGNESDILDLNKYSADNGRILEVDYGYRLQNNYCVDLIIPLNALDYERITDVIFAYKNNLLKNYFNIAPVIVDESFDTMGYDTMFLVKEDFNRSKRLTEKLNIDSQKESHPYGSQLYYKGRELYSESSFVCGNINSNVFFGYNNNIEEVEFTFPKEACFAIFPLVYLQCVYFEKNISLGYGTIHKSLVLKFYKIDNYEYYLQAYQGYFNTLNIPDVKIDLFLNYKK